MTPVFWIVLLSVFSALLPLVGLMNLFSAVRREAKLIHAVTRADSTKVSSSESTVILELIARSYADRPVTVLRDLVFIGLGIASGAVATIWSLFV